MKIERSFHRRGRLGPAAGFTLAELMVAMVIIGLTVGALYAGISQAFTTVRLAREDLRATQILVEKMEAIRLYNWDQITATNFIPESFLVDYDTTASAPSGKKASGQVGLVYKGSVKISPVHDPLSYANDLREVTVELKWTSGSLKRKREITTYVCRTGLQNYIN